MWRNNSFQSDYSGSRDRNYNSNHRHGGNQNRSRYGDDRSDYGDRSSYNPYNRGGNSERRGQSGGHESRYGDYIFDSCLNLGPTQPSLPQNIEMFNRKKIQVNSTVINLARANPVFQYELKLKGFRSDEETEEGVDIYKVPNNDAARNSKYCAFNAIFLKMLKENASIFKSDEVDENENSKHLYVYDRSSLFYSDVDACSTVDERTFEVQTRDIEYKHRVYVAAYKKVQIRLVKTGKIVPAAVIGQPQTVIRPVLQYLDILFNQLPFKNDLYFVFADKIYFKNSSKEIMNANYCLKSGLSKSIRNTKHGIVLQLDAKKSCFYSPRPLLDFLYTEGVSNRDLESCRCRKDILKLIKGIFVTTTHLERNRSFPISALSDLPANQIIFDYKGRKISVADYFYLRYNKLLHYPRYLCVEKRGSFFPLEVLRIVDGQRLVKTRMSPELDQQMIRACQMGPAQVLQEIMDQGPEAGFNNSNPFLKNSGIRIVNPRLEVDGQELPKPAIVYANGIMKLKNNGWRQDNAGYLQSGTIEQLAVISAGRSRIDERRWINDLIDMARQRGLRIRGYELMNLRTSVNDADGIVNFIKDVVRKGFDYLLFLCDSKELHHTIKFTEISTKICTQQVKISSMTKGRNTLENIIHKMNLKAGGRNYGVAMNPEIADRMRCNLIKSALDTTCVVGIEMSHPATMQRADRMLNTENSEPTSVGIAHTTDSTGCVANGDYFFIPRGSTIIDHPKLSEIILNGLREFHLKSGKHATRLLIYRSGISEGAFAKVAQVECSIILRAVQTINPRLAVTMVVVQRKSNHRLFQSRDIMDTINPGTPASIQNVTPGTSINSVVTNSRFKEFIMVAHRSLLGTSKPIVGTVIFESLQDSFTIQQLEHLSNALCYQHEIITTPIVLPGPLRSASDLALRGLNNWKFALNTGSLPDDGRDHSYHRECTKEEEKELTQRTLDCHNKRLRVSITTKKFWA